MNAWLDLDLLRSVTCLGIVYSIHSTMLFAGAWSLARWRRLHGYRERLWKCALIGAVFTATLQTSGWPPSLFSTWTLDPAPVATRAAPLPRAEPAAVTHSPEKTPRILASRVERPTAARGPQSPGPTQAATPTAAQPPWVRRIGLLVLGAVVVALLATAWFSWRSWRRLRGLLRGRIEVDTADLQAELAALAHRAGLRRPPRLTVCTEVSVPVVFGWWRPEICLPQRALTELDPRHLRCVLAHEIAHIARGDLIWRTVRLWTCGSFFFQPLHRVTSRRLQELAEEACDDWAAEQVEDRLGMAACLAEVAGWLRPETLPASVTAMAHGRSNLGRRIERLLDEGTATTVRTTRRTATLTLSTLLFVPLLLTPPIAAAPTAQALLHRAAESAAVTRDTSTTTMDTSTTARAAQDPLNLQNSQDQQDQQDPVAAAIGEVRTELLSLDQELGALRADWSTAALSREQEAVLDQLEARRRALELVAQRLDLWLANRDPAAGATTPNSGRPIDRSSR